MHRLPTGLPNHNSIASEGGYCLIISESVIFFTPKMYLGSHGFHGEPSFIYAEGAPKNWKMALRLRPRIVKHKVSLRFVAFLHVFEDINKALDWLRRSIN